MRSWGASRAPCLAHGTPIARRSIHAIAMHAVRSVSVRPVRAICNVPHRILAVCPRLHPLVRVSIHIFRRPTNVLVLEEDVGRAPREDCKVCDESHERTHALQQRAPALDVARERGDRRRQALERGLSAPSPVLPLLAPCWFLCCGWVIHAPHSLCADAKFACVRATRRRVYAGQNADSDSSLSLVRLRSACDCASAAER